MGIYKRYFNKYKFLFILSISCVFFEAICDLLQEKYVVINAYNELADRGYVQSHIGSGTTVTNVNWQELLDEIELLKYSN